MSAFASSTEYEIKASFIIKLTDYISISGESTSTVDKQNPTFCIPKSLSDTSAAKQLLRQRILSDHFNVQLSSTFGKCDLIFIPTTDVSSLRALLKRMPKTAVVFGDTQDFAVHGVMINFFIENERIRFEINWKKMKENGLTVSSRVLKLARLVGE